MKISQGPRRKGKAFAGSHRTNPHVGDKALLDPVATFGELLEILAFLLKGPLFIRNQGVFSHRATEGPSTTLDT
jgi:hypothetical protein